MFKNIMVAFDGSELAEKALKMGEEIAVQNGATLHVFHTNIIAASLSNQAANSPALQDMLNVAGNKVRDKAQEMLKDSGCTYQIIVQNHPAAPRPIIDYSERNNIDLIIMGSRGLGTMKQYFGSVAHSVLNVTRIPTLIIKE
ncbi:MAG: universal stress protein [Coriobacteriaceae bacterium]|nr:universal stress protein [Coriobacteriaceae bacterium]